MGLGVSPEQVSASYNIGKLKKMSMISFVDKCNVVSKQTTDSPVLTEGKCSVKKVF